MTRKTRPPDYPAQTAEILTRVDLGDDLLSEHLEESKSLESEPDLGSDTAIADQLDSARILQEEGMSDDAKKILRRILILNPHDVVARKALQAIQAQELQSMLNGSAPGAAQRIGSPSLPLESPTQLSEEQIIAELDHDLGLGLIETPSELELGDFLADLESTLASIESEGYSGRDRVDLGIAFLEMGSPRVAEYCFRSARQVFLQIDETPKSRQLWYGATALLAQAQLAAQKNMEALGTLHEALKVDNPYEHPAAATVAAVYEEQQRLELLYLAGRASEALGRSDEASVWYTKVYEIDSRYRDVMERLRQGAKNT